MGLESATDSRELLRGLGNQPGHLMWRAAARVSSNLAAALPVRVDIHGYAALLTLADGAIRSQQSIAELIDVSRTTMAKVANALTAEGFVERVRNPDDRRQYLLSRTREGTTAVRRWRRWADDLETTLAPGLELSEHEELRRLLLGVLDGELAPDTPTPLLESLGFLVTRAHLRMHRTFSDALAPLGIVPPHFGLLSTVNALGPVPQAVISRRLGVTPAAVVQMVDELEERGLVERRRLEWDRRNQVVHLHPEARTVLKQAHHAAHSTLSTRLGNLDLAQRARLVVLLQRFVTGEPGPPATGG